MSSFRELKIEDFKLGPRLKQFLLLYSVSTSLLGVGVLAIASDWDEDSPKKPSLGESSNGSADGNSSGNGSGKSKVSRNGNDSSGLSSASTPLQGKVEKAGEGSTRIRRNADPNNRGLGAIGLWCQKSLKCKKQVGVHEGWL